MCSGVQHTFGCSRNKFVVKLQFSQNKITNCTCEYFQYVENSVHISCVAGDVSLFENVIRVEFSLFFSSSSSIKFDKLTFYGQNTWFSLFGLPKKENYRNRSDNQNYRLCTNGTKILLLVFDFLSFARISVFTKLFAVLLMLFQSFIFSSTFFVASVQLLSRTSWPPNGQWTDIQSHIQYVTNTYGFVNFRSI